MGNKTFGDAPFGLSATGGASGNAVVFASTTPGTCSVSSSTVTIEHAGSCTITANQAGNDDYNMAAEVSQSFTIAKAAATLTLSDLTHTYDGSPKAATVTVTPSGLSVVSVTYDGSATAPTNAGSYAVVASLTNNDYEATDATGTLVISKAAQTIVFTTAVGQDLRRRSLRAGRDGRRLRQCGDLREHDAGYLLGGSAAPSRSSTRAAAPSPPTRRATPTTRMRRR